MKTINIIFWFFCMNPTKNVHKICERVCAYAHDLNEFTNFNAKLSSHVLISILKLSQSTVTSSK